MGHRDDGAGVALQVLLEPGDAFGVQVVRRLVQKQDVWLLQEQAAKGDAALLTAGEVRHVGFRRRAAQGVHGELQAAVQVPGVQVVELLLHLRLTVAELLHIGVAHLLAELHVDLVEFVHQVDDFLHPFLDALAYRLGRVELRLLR